VSRFVLLGAHTSATSNPIHFHPHHFSISRSPPTTTTTPLQRNPPEPLPRQRSLLFSAPPRLLLKVEPPLTSRTTTTRTQPTFPLTRITTTTRTQHPFFSTVSPTVRQSPAFNSNENANTKFSLPAEKLPQPCLHATIPICRE
jgi:hypothetical protein